MRVHKMFEELKLNREQNTVEFKESEGKNSSKGSEVKYIRSNSPSFSDIY